MAYLASGLLAVLVVVRVVRGFLRALVGLVGYLGLVGLVSRLVAFVLVVLGVFRLGLRGLDFGLRAFRREGLGLGVVDIGDVRVLGLGGRCRGSGR